MLFAACAADDTAGVVGGSPLDSSTDGPIGQPVLFSAGNVAPTRADGVPYMEQDGRFVCTMYYHPGSGHGDTDPYDIRSTSETGTASTAWLRVNNNVGNSVYWNKNFPDNYNPTLDTQGFDESATKFYWQNRLTHAFLAFADYNKLKDNDGATSEQGKLKMYPNHDIDFMASATEPDPMADNRYANTFDLTRGTRTSMAQQPDPILALTIQKPEGATQEANRVNLYFRHQFSQIQVNIKGPADGSADIQPEQIDKVELLGVSEEGYVVTRLNTNGTVGNVPANSAAGTMKAASAKAVSLSGYPDDYLKNINKWGTTFEMFDMKTGIIEDGHDKGYAIGFLKSFNAIAFGTLWAIRVTWHELVGEQIKHISTYEVPQTNEMASKDTETPAEDDKKPIVYLRELQSGMRYVYEFELRRGTLAVIRTQILDWEQHENLVYDTNGTISKEQ